jgi:hypothetical protein
MYHLKYQAWLSVDVLIQIACCKGTEYATNFPIASSFDGALRMRQLLRHKCETGNLNAFLQAFCIHNAMAQDILWVPFKKFPVIMD